MDKFRKSEIILAQIEAVLKKDSNGRKQNDASGRPDAAKTLDYDSRQQMIGARLALRLALGKYRYGMSNLVNHCERALADQIEEPNRIDAVESTPYL